MDVSKTSSPSEMAALLPGEHSAKVQSGLAVAHLREIWGVSVFTMGLLRD